MVDFPKTGQMLVGIYRLKKKKGLNSVTFKFSIVFPPYILHYLHKDILILLLHCLSHAELSLMLEMLVVTSLTLPYLTWTMEKPNLAIGVRNMFVQII